MDTNMKAHPYAIKCVSATTLCRGKPETGLKNSGKVSRSYVFANRHFNRHRHSHRPVLLDVQKQQALSKRLSSTTRTHFCTIHFSRFTALFTRASSMSLSFSNSASFLVGAVNTWVHSIQLPLEDASELDRA